jgi:cytochrome c peroxidase
MNIFRFTPMKKTAFFIALVIGIACCFNACRNNPVTAFWVFTGNEADSNYTGTKYHLPDLDAYFGKPLIAYTDSMTYEGVELGRRLFYDKHLSKSGQKSCASCHNLQYALTDSGNRFSANETGLTTRNAPALQNLAWSGTFFWDGRAGKMADQQRDAFDHELNFKVKDAIAYLNKDTTDVKLFRKAFGQPGNITEDKIYLAIEQFLLSAVSHNSKFDSVMMGLAQFTPSEHRGYYNIFFNERGECLICHRAPLSVYLLTGNAFKDNGLDYAPANKDFADAGRGAITKNQTDYGKFKTPTLRNVALTAPYMHDGRIKTLRQVIDFYSDSIKLSPNLDAHLLLHIQARAGAGGQPTGGMHFSEQEKTDLLNFLNTLTDTAFINNPALKNPY